MLGRTLYNVVVPSSVGSGCAFVANSSSTDDDVYIWAGIPIYFFINGIIIIITIMMIMIHITMG